MKKIIAFILMAFVLGSVDSLACKRDKAADEAMARKVAEAVTGGNFKIWVTSIHPSAGPTKSSLREYCITVKDGKADGRLPFIGTSHVPVFGSEDPAVILEQTPVEISTGTSGRKRKLEYHIDFKTEGTHDWNGEITIWENGTASIRCISNSASSMSYNAELEFCE